MIKSRLKVLLLNSLNLLISEIGLDSFEKRKDLYKYLTQNIGMTNRE